MELDEETAAMYGFVCDPWKIIQTRFTPGDNRVAESLFTLGNEYMGLRGFFEEDYSGDTLPGTYVGGIYYLDKAKAGRGKNGYPEHFAKVPNSINWIAIRLYIDGQEIDLAQCLPVSFRRELDMRNGCLTREVLFEDSPESRFQITFRRFLSMDDRHIAVVSVEIMPLDRDIRVEAVPCLEGKVLYEDTDDGEPFWTIEQNRVHETHTYLAARTKKTGFLLGVAQSVEAKLDGMPLQGGREICSSLIQNGYRIRCSVSRGSVFTLDKYVAVYTSRDLPEEEICQAAVAKAARAAIMGRDALFARHAAVMARRWESLDVRIDGDDLAQQGIRYSIFQLFQTYYGYDPDLNIAPMGYSGQKYGGLTHWDTEAFCFPFYLYNDSAIALRLLLYRHRQLAQAKENAKKLGLQGALYPVVTVNGEECHNEWETASGEIHQNGAIAYAIYHYTRYTGDYAYLKEKGIEVLIELCRFWISRASYSVHRGRYVILGVTGPNTYENNVNNNWYTNTMAAWTLDYTLKVLGNMPNGRIKALGVSREEMEAWRAAADGMHLPYDEGRQIFVQQDLFMDKILMPVSALDPGELPLHRHWSWDRILRSCFIRQADVLQGIYFFPERYDTETQRRHFLFYEPMTVHESSLSASVHAVIAARAGLWDKAYELYLRTARLDLEDINHDTADGIHLASMAGSWNAVVQGFAGMEFDGDTLSFSPYLPPQWEGYSFRVRFRGATIGVSVTRDGTVIRHLSGPAVKVVVKPPDRGQEITAS